MIIFLSFLILCLGIYQLNFGDENSSTPLGGAYVFLSLVLMERELTSNDDLLWSLAIAGMVFNMTLLISVYRKKKKIE